jgi:hypothetical protein
MRRVTITFTQEEAEALLRMARDERRHPRDQAAYLLAQVLRCDAPAEGMAVSGAPTEAIDTWVRGNRQEAGDAAS